MISLRAASSLAVICLAMVLTDCTDMREIISTIQENPLSGPFPDPCKILNFPQEFPFPCLKDFPGSIVPPTLSPIPPFPFSQLNNCFSSEPLAGAPETITPPAEASTY